MSPPIGAVNKNGQLLIAKLDRRGNHRFAKLWLPRCTDPGCGVEYEANSCDFHIRRCPDQGGKPSSA